jgi:GTP-binding protein
MKSPARVAIVGRPNVGKSTLFNRITGKRKAIVHPQPGVTRDVQRCDTEWSGVVFEVIDTGGLFSGEDDSVSLEAEERALREALSSDVMMFITDANLGVTGADMDVAEKLRKAKIPVFLAVNKVEKKGSRFAAAEFYKLGFDNLYEISALHGLGVGELLDDVVALLPKRSARSVAEELKIAIVGRPNVGKSTLLNALVGKEANIVDSKPGTTRDSIDIHVRWNGRDITLVDTAGIKRKSRTKDGLGALSALKSIDTISRADVVILVLDAAEAISNQDVKVASYAHKAAKGIMICVNKWDLIEKDNRTASASEKDIRGNFRFMAYAPILHISALQGQRLSRIFPMSWKIKDFREKRIATSELNDFLEHVIRGTPAPWYHGGTGKIYYGTQVDVSPPQFTFFVNKREYFSRNYLRFLNNQLREQFTFEGTLIRIKLVERRRGARSA